MIENFSQLAGLGGLTLVRQLVQMTGVKGIWAVLASMAFGIVLNVAFAISVGNDIVAGIAIGIMTGLFSNLYEDSKRI